MKISQSGNTLVSFLFLIEPFSLCTYIVPKIGYLQSIEIFAGADKACISIV